MNKQELEQYKFLKQEIKDIQERIQKDIIYIDDLEQEIVTDSVVCGRKGKKPLRTVKISGYPSTEANKRKALLRARISAREKQENKLIKLENQIEEFINDVNDARVRLIIKYRYFDNMSWEGVANKLGGDNTPDGARMILDRFLKNK